MASRSPRRSSAATPLVQRIYLLLTEHPEGMTVSQLHDALRHGWTDTEAYRAYERRMVRRRGVSGRGPHLAGSAQWDAQFQEHARQWWIGYRLHGMLKFGRVRREGKGKDALWYAGDRGPRTMVSCPIHGYHLAPLDAGAALAQARAEEAEIKRRHEVQVQLREGLNDNSLSRDTLRSLLQLAHDYISDLPEWVLPGAALPTQQPSGRRKSDE